MTARLAIDLSDVPRLSPYMRLRHDHVREVWTIQAPERTFILDDTAYAILSRCDGAATVSEIVDSLCEAFTAAPREVIEKDVIVLLQDFADKAVMTA
jgi:coenzyme PQQ biosynthesis protein PqqD